MCEEGLFRVPGANAEISELRSAFERGDDPLQSAASAHDPNAIAGLVKLYLRELKDPVMTFENYPLFVALDKLQDEEQMTRAVRELMMTKMPPAHIDVLLVLLPFLAKVSTYSKQNKMDVNNLAMVFGPTLLQDGCRLFNDLRIGQDGSEGFSPDPLQFSLCEIGSRAARRRLCLHASRGKCKGKQGHEGKEVLANHDRLRQRECVQIMSHL